jgi:glycerophosphoryl diester phosphodiesterase
MVKFGVHLEAFLSENAASQLYIVPYCDIRDQFVEQHLAVPDGVAVSVSVSESVPVAESESESKDGATAADRFAHAWNACLKLATTDFDIAMTALWSEVFLHIAADPESRGATPEKALRLHLLTAGVTAAPPLLARINAIYETSLTNSEALRKLVKKFDKQHGTQLSLKLLPQMYAANFTIGQPTLEDGLSMLRHALGSDTDYDEDEPSPIRHPTTTTTTNSPGTPSDRARSLERDRRGQQHDAAVYKRKEELMWLKNLVHQVSLHDDHHYPQEDPDLAAETTSTILGPPSSSSLPPKPKPKQTQLQQHMVAHRGFHNPLDRSDRRPLENSLQAYEAAWTNGIHLCECDIALTKDEKIVLAHDADFSRLALDQDSPMFHRQVRDLTFRELIALPLKSGIRPPLLIDVLRSAQAIQGNSQLIIEIKPGNNEAAKALGRLLLRHMDLMEQVAVIMSFDAFAMHTLRNDLAVLLHPSPSDHSSYTTGNQLRPGHRSAMSLGNMTMLVDALSLDERNDNGGFIPLGDKRGSSDHFGVGLSLSFRDLEGHHMNHINNNNNNNNNNHSLPPLAPTTPSSNGGGAISNSHGTFHKDMMAAKLEQRKRRLPKLMLLTVSDNPKIPCELQVSLEEQPLLKIDQWLHRDDGALDGVYMQYEPQMLSPEGLVQLRLLASKYTVGVWNKAHKDPDDFETFHTLVKEGLVSFVNSDLPKGFMKPKNGGGSAHSTRSF